MLRISGSAPRTSRQNGKNSGEPMRPGTSDSSKSGNSERFDEKALNSESGVAVDGSFSSKSEKIILKKIERNNLYWIGFKILTRAETKHVQII